MKPQQQKTPWMISDVDQEKGVITIRRSSAVGKSEVLAHTLVKKLRQEEQARKHRPLKLKLVTLAVRGAFARRPLK